MEIVGMNVRIKYENVPFSALFYFVWYLSNKSFKSVLENTMKPVILYGTCWPQPTVQPHESKNYFSSNLTCHVYNLQPVAV